MPVSSKSTFGLRHVAACGGEHFMLRNRLRTALYIALPALLVSVLTACKTSELAEEKITRGNTKEYFSEKAYGVAIGDSDLFSYNCVLLC